MNDDNEKDFENSDYDDFGFSDDETASSDIDDGYGGDYRTEEHFEEDEHDTHMDQHHQKPNSNDFLMYVVIAVVLGIPLIWAFKDTLFGSSTQQIAVSTQQPVVNVATNTSQPIVQGASNQTGTSVTVTDPSQLVQKQPVAPAVSSAQFKSLENQLIDLGNRLTVMESSLQESTRLRDDIADLKRNVMRDNRTAQENQQKVSQISQSIQSLDSNVNKMTRELYQQVLSLSTNRVEVKGKQKDEFVVMATIPTRAWLRNQAGVLITVREGEIIPGYGKVLRIDPVNGIVVMSNKKTFVEESRIVTVDE